MIMLERASPNDWALKASSRRCHARGLTPGFATESESQGGAMLLAAVKIE
jgi:hypothetical protein